MPVARVKRPATPPRPAYRPLFDPAVEQPPRSAVDFCWETPVSVCVYYDQALRVLGGDRTAGQGYLLGHPEVAEEVIEAILAAREAGVAAALDTLCREGGYLKVGPHHPRPGRASVGKYLPGQLCITRVPHEYMLGRHPDYEPTADLARLHDHIFIGADGVADEDRQWWPVDHDSLRKPVMQMAAVAHRAALEDVLAARLGVRWSVPPGGREAMYRPPIRQAFRDIVVPDVEDGEPWHPRAYCSWGLWRCRRWNVADELYPNRDPDAS